MRKPNLPFPGLGHLTHLSPKGQLTIPAALRRRLGWRRGDALRLEPRRGRVALRRVRRAATSR